MLSGSASQKIPLPDGRCSLETLENKPGLGNDPGVGERGRLESSDNSLSLCKLSLGNEPSRSCMEVVSHGFDLSNRSDLTHTRA